MILQRIFRINKWNIYFRKFFSAEINKYNIYPSCKNCKNYIKNKHDSLSTCKKHKYYNHKTYEMEYELADYVRKNNNSCGHEGRFYSRNRGLVHDSKSK